LNSVQEEPDCAAPNRTTKILPGLNPCCKGCSILYDPMLLRQICRELSVENDPEKVQDLVALLRAVVENDQAKLRSESHHLVDRYPFLRERLKH
jgi:hypothetical protein